MLYIIDEVIEFNAADGTLTRLQDGDVIKLSIPASRLLEFLLSSPNGFLDREYLLSEVWDKYGLRGSYSNLNQYISILRRTLANLGCENFILTVPKWGFRINPETPFTAKEIIFETIEKSPKQPDTDNHDVPPLPPPVADTSQDKPSYRYLKIARKESLIILLFCLLFILIFLTVTNNTKNNQLDSIRSVLANNCNVTYIQSISQRDRDKVNQQIEKILTENKLRCDGNRRIFFDNYTSSSPTNLGRTLLSYCKVGPDGNIVSCNNYYFYDRRIQ